MQGAYAGRLVAAPFGRLIVAGSLRRFLHLERPRRDAVPSASLDARGRFDAMLLDPPRAGAAEVIADIRRLSATKVVYVSCHPATLARDVRELCRRGYALSSVQPIDLFPHTYHLEVIAALLLT